MARPKEKPPTAVEMRLAALCEREGLNGIVALAAAIGREPATVQKWGARDSIPKDGAQAIADRFGYSLGWILTGVDLSTAAGLPSPAKRRSPPTDGPPADGPPTDGPLADGMVEVCGVDYASVPRFDASLSAGPGCIIPAQPHPMGYALFENQWLRAVTAAPPTALALLRVDGESMMPTLNDGDWVLIDRQQRNPAREGIYALAVDDAAWVKRLSVNKPAGTVIIESDNKLWKTQEWPAETVSLIGRVIWLFGRKIV